MDHDTTLKKFLLDKAEERWEKAEAEIQRRKEAFENRQESAAATSLNQVISKSMEKNSDFSTSRSIFTLF